jgi:anti-anti-sigma regulatory factor
MSLRIQKSFEGPAVVLRLSGRIQAEGLVELANQLEGVTGKIVLDFKEVTLVDREVVHFLGMCIGNGVELRHCAPYIVDWIQRERRES